MSKVVEAIYAHGMLEPLESLDLPEQTRVELTVRPIDGSTSGTAESWLPTFARTSQEQAAALNEILEEIDRMDLRLRVRFPTRDELHERG